MNKNGKTAFGVILAIFLGTVLAGTAMVPDPLTFVTESCYDGIDNDNDSPSMIPGANVDLTDAECIWMPFTVGGWASGEYDGQGISYPPMSDVSVYSQQWNTSTDHPTHFEGVKSIFDYFNNPNYCGNQILEDSLVYYRDTLNIPDSRTGVNEYQSECGVTI